MSDFLEARTPADKLYPGSRHQSISTQKSRLNPRRFTQQSSDGSVRMTTTAGVAEPETGQPIRACTGCANGCEGCHGKDHVPEWIREGQTFGLPIPDEAVEAGAKALSPGWDWINPEQQDGYRSDARLALTAALPHLGAAIRADEQAKVRKRVEALPLIEDDDIRAGIIVTESLNNALRRSVLLAIDEGEQ